ncbi:hypothetical protein AMTRI_Chr10g230310 [Amborella trichopoda]
MESDMGKLFIGGISWETNEDRLKEYFKTYGEIVEAVIMKDRTTGRARGFGFVVFSDPAVADRVVLEKHTIDGRTVEAKKAVPRDDQQILNRNSNSIHGSPSPARTKKIFVGGLASTVTENDFRKYFDQFGTITDVVVMYDHNTQRPRGFGFITYDSEDAVDKVLLETYHKLNGKTVEVKRAVPKELSPGPSRIPLGYGMNRVNSFLNGYPQGYNQGSLGGYGMRMDGRFGPLVGSRGGFPTFSPQTYPNYGPAVSPSYGGSNFGSNLGFGRGLGPYYGGNNASRYGSPIGYNGSSGGSGSFLSPTGRNVWGNSGLNYSASATSTGYTGSGSGSIGGFGNTGATWGSSPSMASQVGGSGGGYGGGGSFSYGSSENGYGLGMSSFGGRTSGTGLAPSSYSGSNGGYEGSYGDLYGGSSVYGDPTWRSGSTELDGSSSFSYGLGTMASDVATKGSGSYMGGYSVSNRQSNRGVAA